MKLLVFTQKMDRNDTVLGFFHDWVVRLAQKSEKVYVICLQKGDCDLPNNVEVFSLGKEKTISRLKYILNLFKYLKKLSGLYDRVFVHMNQEYILLAGLYWKIKGIPVFFWRNHPNGTLLTNIAVALSTKVFCTSTSSYTAKYKKTFIMPAGINTELFKQNLGVMRKKYSICMVGRISPVKNVDLALEVVDLLVGEGAQISFSIIGDTPNIDRYYFEELTRYIESNNLSKVVNFVGGVSSVKLPEVYSGYELCLNLTESGSFDKTIVEATSCGTIPIVSSESFSSLLPAVCITDKNPHNIANTIKRMLDATEQLKIQKDLEKFVASQSLEALFAKLFIEIE